MTALLFGEVYDTNKRTIESPVLYLKGKPDGSQFIVEACKIPGKSGKK
jgi:hypothetical protein